MASPHDFVVSDELLQKYEMTRTELANRLNAHLQHTLLGALDMRYAELSTDRVVMRMPVSAKTRQLFGFLHGGASVALAETAASVAALLNIDSRTHAAFGMEINANHIRSKKRRHGNRHSGSFAQRTHLDGMGCPDYRRAGEPDLRIAVYGCRRPYSRSRSGKLARISVVIMPALPDLAGQASRILQIHQMRQRFRERKPPLVRV